MQSAAGQPSFVWGDPANRRRVVSFVLAVAVHLLLLLLLLRLTPPQTVHAPSGGTTTVFNVPTPSPEKKAAKRSSARQFTQHAASGAPRPAAKQPTQAPKPTNTAAQPWVLNPEIAGFNLSTVPSQPSTQVAASSGASGSEAGTDAGSTKGAGTGPGGVQLYAAEWVREPTDAEMSPYMPHGHYAGGWADIACRTIPRFHVEDCEELGQSPPGSGLSRALREASFQFLVRPPRINGKAMVGEWVRIHFDFIERGKE